MRKDGLKMARKPSGNKGQLGTRLDMTVGSRVLTSLHLPSGNRLLMLGVCRHDSELRRGSERSARHRESRADDADAAKATRWQHHHTAGTAESSSNYNRLGSQVRLMDS